MDRRVKKKNLLTKDKIKEKINTLFHTIMIFILFGTDPWQSLSSRVPLGAYDSQEKAEDAAEKNNVDHYTITELEKNVFHENGAR